MSTKHFIEKLLAEPHRPQIHEDKVLPERAPHNYDEMLKEEKVEYRTSRKCILHLPREYRRQIYNNQYPLQQTICHSRPSKCFCSNCNHDPLPWLGDPQTPRFIGKVHGYPAHSRRSYSMEGMQLCYIYTQYINACNISYEFYVDDLIAGQTFSLSIDRI